MINFNDTIFQKSIETIKFRLTLGMFRSFLLSLILIGTIAISSTLLLELLGSPQQVWAHHSITILPTLVKPENGMSSNDLTPLFDWKGISGINLYRIQIDNNNDFSSPEIDVVTTDSQFKPPTNLPPGTYSWKVSARHGNVDGTFSITRTAILTLQPPTLVKPENGMSSNDLTPLFDWKGISGINLYRIQIDNNNDFSSPEIDSTSIRSDFTPSSSLLPGRYNWQVSGLVNDVRGTSSIVQTFNTMDNTLPQSPTLLKPSDGEFTNDRSTSFDWTDISDNSLLVTYEFYVDINYDFSSPEIYKTSLSLSNLTIDMDLADGLYYWKVRAKDGAGNAGSFSPVFSFTIDATAPQISASPPGGLFEPSGIQVTLLSTDPNSKIYYTTDGSNPNASSIEYTKPVDLISTSTVKAVAVDAVGNIGNSIQEQYSLDTTSPTVSIEPQGKTFGADGISLILSSNDPNSKIYYTTDGSNPNASSIEYTKPVDLISTSTVKGVAMTVKAVAIDAAGNIGTMVNKDYVDGAVGSISTLNSQISLDKIVPMMSGYITSSDLEDASGNMKEIPAGSPYSASGRLLDNTGKPLADQIISLTTDNSSPVQSTTDSQGHFETTLTAPKSLGEHVIQAHFFGDIRYSETESELKQISVVGNESMQSTSLSMKEVTIGQQLQEEKEKYLSSVGNNTLQQQQEQEVQGIPEQQQEQEVQGIPEQQQEQEVEDPVREQPEEKEKFLNSVEYYFE